MNKNQNIIFSLIFSIGLIISGCGTKGSNGSEMYIEEVISELNRDMSPQASNDEIRTLADNNNAFAFDIFKELRRDKEEANIFFSPYSISEALVMTYPGAKGETKTQMAEALHFDQEEPVLHTAFNALDLHLNFQDDNYTLSVANSLWPQKGFGFEQPYVDAIMINYGAKLRLLDYVNETEQARTTINNWVEEKTYDRIKDLIPQGALDSFTRLILVNAIYFKGQWVEQFDEENTKDEQFTLINGMKITTPMMNQTEYHLYSEGESYQAIELPYKNGRTSMLIVLPKEGMFDKVINEVNAIYDESVTALSSTNVILKMPKFEFTTGVYALNEPLQNMGMVKAFDSYQADFSGMTQEAPLYISHVLHKAFIKVNEDGSEAAAATAVIIGVTSIGPSDDPVQMYVNRPFLFFIKDQLSQQILFMGVVTQPVQE